MESHQHGFCWRRAKLEVSEELFDAAGVEETLEIRFLGEQRHGVLGGSSQLVSS